MHSALGQSLEYNIAGPIFFSNGQLERIIVAQASRIPESDLRSGSLNVISILFRLGFFTFSPPNPVPGQRSSQPQK